MKCLIRSAAGFALLLPCSLEGQGVVTGTVREDSSGRPLSAVEILLDGSARRAVTDGAGRFMIPGVTPGDHLVLFRIVGFRPIRSAIRLAGTDTVWVNPLLVASAVELPPVEVNAEEKKPFGPGIEGFEERRKMGFGVFVDSKELRQSEHLKVGEIIRRRSRVVLVGLNGAPANFSLGFPVYAVSSRKGLLTGLPCWMQIIVDGQPLYRAGLDKFPPDLNNDFTVTDLEAMEIYYGAGGTPSEFNSAGAACGTIVLWTRRGLKP